ncbi:PAS domain S-box protein [Fischerella sp. JS2]|uniref:PAS domain S-box protein n=1 Tax=Fischerella sp. JS2 TaxID=2597771 RepID=UPI0028E45A43|nr:PAS domain S-box protein [Fischerella sp. JS2]
MFPEKLQDDIAHSKSAEDRVLVTAMPGVEEPLCVLADTAPVMIWMAGCDAVCTYFNPAWLEFTGRSHLVEVGLGWLAGVHPEDRQQCQEQYISALKRHKKFNRQYRLRRVDGEYRWILDTVTSRFTANGCFAGYIGYCVDITDVKVKKYSLIESETRLRLALDAAEIGVWDWNFKTKQVSCSEQVEQILGWTPNYTPTNYKAFLKHVYKSDRSIVSRAIRSTLHSKTSYDTDFRVWQDGSVRWLRGKGDVLRDHTGQVTRMMGTLLDITERKLAELAVEEAKQQLETRVEERTAQLIRISKAIESTSDAIAIADITGKPIYHNQAFIDLFGYSVEDMQAVGGPSAVYVNVTEAETVFTTIQTGQSWSGVLTMKNRSGNLIQIDLRADAIKNTNGKIIGLIGIHTDISDHRQAEKALQASYSLLYSVIDSTSDLIFAKDLEGHHVMVNSSFANFVKKPIKEIISKKDTDFFPVDIASSFREADNRITNTGISETIEEYIPSNGIVHIYLSTKSPWRDAQGNIIGVIGIAREITERKSAEAALRESEAQYRRLIETAAEGIWILDTEGKTSFVNPKMAQMLGYTAEEMIGMPLFAFMDAQGQAIATQQLERRQQGIAEQHDFKFCRKDGSELWTMIATNPIRDAAGQYVGTLGMLTDITDRKRAEEALQRSEARNSAMLNAIPDLMFRSNREGIYLDYVAAKDTKLAAPASEIIGKSIDDLLPPNLAQQARYYTEQALTQRSIQIFEYQLPIEGELHDYEARIVPSGEDEILAIVREISDRKKAEAALQALVAGTASVTGEEFFPVLVRHLAAALGVRYAMVAEKIGTEYTKARVLAFWIDDNLKENFEFDLAHTPCEIAIQEGIAYYPYGLQQVFPLNQDLVAMQAESYLGAAFLDSSGVAIGHIAVFDTKPLLAEERAKAILSIFAARATAELQRQRTEDALWQSERQFREVASKEALLNRLASQIRASLDINQILENAVTEVRNLLQLDMCIFTWYRSEAQPPYWENVQEARNPAIPSLLNLRSTTQEVGPIAEKVLQKAIIRFDDVEAISDPVSRQFFVSVGLKASLVLPVHTQSGEIGSLSCNHFTSRRTWLDNEVELLLAVTDQIAIAIDQAELYKQSRIAAQTAQEKAQQLEETLQELQATQAQLVQTEKMSSLGQLVAGIAHEINNPVNFIHGNITHASTYAQDLLHLVELYQQHYPQPVVEIEEEIEAIDLEFLCQDLPKLLASMKIGTDRIRQIVLSLRNFSRLDEAEMKAVDIHEGIDSTLLLLQHRLKAKPDHPEIQVIKEYSNLPLVDCYPGQLNQVFMNLLANAIDALEEPVVKDSQQLTMDNGHLTKPQIRIRTEIKDDLVLVCIADNGTGMTEEVRQKLFDPFFTTKPVGKGTGMGLSISYKIIVEKHQGKIKCISAPGQGSEFIVAIPQQQPQS